MTHRFQPMPIFRRSTAARSSSRPPGVVPAVDARGRGHCRAAGRTFRDVALVVALAAVPAETLGAKPWDWTSQGLVDVRARANETSATRLMPDPGRLGLDRRFLSVTAVGAAQAWKGPVTLSGAGRLFARTVPREGERAVRLHVDELHAELMATPEHYFYAGRRHIVHGRSLGVNPLDIAVDPLDIDRSKDTERRRSELEGQDMLGFESLFGDRFTLTAYWTPGERALLAGSFTLPEWKSDLTALAFDDARPGAGLSLSRTLGESLLGYADVSLRRGRDRMVIRPDRRPEAAAGAFLTEEDDGAGLFAQSSIGAGYTLASGATFNLEYHFDANGYSTGEWEEIAGLIATNAGNRSDARLRESATGHLLWLTGQLDRFTLRRRYAFFRAQHPGLFGRDVAGAMIVFHNLADHSGSLSLRLERAMGPNLFLGIEGRRLYGGGLDEFALRTPRLTGSVHLTVNF